METKLLIFKKQKDKLKQLNKKERKERIIKKMRVEDHKQFKEEKEEIKYLNESLFKTLASEANNNNEWKIIFISDFCRESLPCQHGIHIKNRLTKITYEIQLKGDLIYDWLSNGFASKDILNNFNQYKHFSKYEDLVTLKRSINPAKKDFIIVKFYKNEKDSSYCTLVRKLNSKQLFPFTMSSEQFLDFQRLNKIKLS